MPEPLVLIAAFGGLGLVIVAVSRLNGGSPVDFSGLFPAQGRTDWPQGVQEGDAPHFAVDHVDALRSARPAPGPPGPSIRELGAAEPTITWTEPVAANVHRLVPKR